MQRGTALPFFTVGPTGRILTSIEVVTLTDTIEAGFAYDTFGAIKINNLTPQVYLNGFGFNSGALCTSSGPIATYNQGLPFDSTGRLIIADVAPITHYASGLPFTASGLAVSVSNTPQPPSYELREDAGFELREDAGFEMRE